MEKFFHEWLSSWNGNRPHELIKFYHDFVFYSDPAFKEGIKGKDQLCAYLEKLLAKNPDWRWEMVHYDQVSPTRFYVKWKASIPKGENLITEHGIDLVEIKDHKIFINEVYFDASSLVKKH